MKDNINNILEFVQFILNLTGHQESSQTKMKDAEVITTAIVAGIYFNGNFQKALTFFEDYPHFDYVLSKSRFSRRLANLGSTLSKIMDIIMEYNKNRSKTKEFMIDSFPFSVCDNYRIPRCKIYLDHDLYRGYISSKRKFFSEQDSI
ncbi:hypothetical protein [uncultured Ilyobacter sp.]|uniref:hypothetical protein n=1 Tax=uncultured Ilyobacter sp. TaxID=544433 RepID=UPI0029C0B3E0|nr:hypothetical protein [uncultured Ilyobacter sp.]